MEASEHRTFAAQSAVCVRNNKAIVSSPSPSNCSSSATATPTSPVQDIVDNSRMSARTFYRFFASKDDLLVAVTTTVISTFVVPQMQARCNAEPDPIRRLRAYIEGVFDLVTESLPVSARALTVYYQRLHRRGPSDLEAADKPQIDLIVSLLREACDPERVGTSLDLDSAALLVHRTLLSIVHARLLGSASAVPRCPSRKSGSSVRTVSTRHEIAAIRPSRVRRMKSIS